MDAAVQLDALCRAEWALEQIEQAAERVAQACRAEMELEDERSIMKPLAVRRIMTRDGLAATPAEKLVETDGEYLAHRRKQYEIVVEKERARGLLDAATLRARLLVGLATGGSA